MPKIISIKVTPHAKQNKIILLDDGSYKIFVTAAPENGKANKAAAKILADYFKIAPTKIEIISGLTSRKKLFRIN